jgi:uncharacterized iron-regulated protein
MRPLAALILLVAGCATSAQSQQPAQPHLTMTAQPAEAQQAEVEEDATPDQPRHGHRRPGPAVPIALPHRVVDGGNGDELTERAFDERLRAARVIFVGEEHANPHDHAAEIEVLERAFAADPSLGFAFEMLPRTYQASLDAYVAGTIDEKAFLKAVDWEQTWGYPWGLYKPLLEFCRAHRLPAFALNAPQSLAHAIALKGVAGLTRKERAQVPELKPGPAAHREMVREAFAQHPHGRFNGEAFEHFYEAQLVWDETMAERIAAALTGEHAPKHLVVVAGAGHTQKFAVPDRAARRGARPYLTILPVFDEDEADARADKVADILWVEKTR